MKLSRGVSIISDFFLNYEIVCKPQKMRRKATVTNSTQLSALGNGASEKSEENTHLKVIKQIERPSKTPAGKGLGKAGAKRLGRLLKRAIPNQDEATGKANASLPSESLTVQLKLS